MGDLHELLPRWADRRATGYDDVGASLPTRDGRRIGNASTIAVEQHSELGKVVTVRSDAGNELRLTLAEMSELFWPPIWHQREILAPRAPAMAEK